MKPKILDLIDFEKVNVLLEGFNKSTGFVTAILDLEGNVLSKSGWRQICTEFHRVNPETSRKCTISDTVLAGKLAEGEKYHFYQCLNGLVDVAVPIVIKGEHIANLFSGQFFLEEPDRKFFKKQAEKYRYDERKYLEALEKVPVVSKEKVLKAMDFLLDMTQLISETAFQRLEQTELNKTIRKSEDKFKSVFESANVGKSITLPTGEIEANEAFCEMLGYTREELENKRWQEITPDEEIPTIEKILEPLLKGKKDSARFEKRYICKNGTHIWVDVSISALRAESGKLLYFIATIIDITERKRAEAMLQASEQKYRSLVEHSLSNVHILDRDGVFQMMSASAAALYGGRPTDFVGKSLFDVNSKVVADEYYESNCKIIESGVGRTYEKTWELPSGRKTFLVDEQVIKDDQGVNIALQISSVDISSRVQAEEKLKRNQELIEESQRIGKVGGWEFNMDTMELTWTMEVFRIHEVDKNYKPTVDEAINFYTPASRPIIEQAIQRAIDIGEPYDVELEIITAKGNHRYVQAKGKADLEHHRVIGFFQDITERKQAERELKESQYFFEQLFIQSSTSTQLLDSEGWCVKINPKLTELFGVNPEDIEGKKYNILHDGEIIRTGVINHLKKVFEHKETVRWEVNFDIQHASETTGVQVSKPEKRWFQNVAYPIINAEGKLIYVIVQHEDITERKNSEKALRESEEKFSILFGQASLPTALTQSPGHEFVDVNDAFVELFGFTKEELIGKTSIEIGLNRNVESRTQNIEKIKGQRQLLNSEQNFFSKSGKQITILTNVSAVEINGKDHAVFSLQDITESKRIEKALRESEELLRLLTELANVAAWEFDFTTNSMQRSKNHDSLYGLEVQEKWEFETFLNATHPDDREMSNAHIQKSVAIGGPDEYKFDFRVIYPDQSVHWLNVIGEVIQRNEKGEGILVRGFLIDITDRKLMEEEVLKSRLTLQAAFSSMTDAIFISDAEGNYIDFNDAFVTFHRFKNRKECEKALTEKSEFMEVFNENNEKIPMDMWAVPRALRGETIINYEVTLHRKNTGKTWFGSYSFSPIRDQDGVIVGSVVVARDVTEKKLVEEELKSLNLTLEQRVFERTAQLQSANKELESFSYSISHDLRAPLRAIYGFSQIIAERHRDSLNAEGKQYVNYVVDASKRMEQLINDLLSYSRLGRSALTLRPVSLKKIVEAVYSDIQAELLEIGGTFEIENALPTIRGDESLLRQIFSNLVGNSIKYRRTDTPLKITIQSKQVAQGYQVKITDNGIGISEKYFDKIFNVFQRLHNESKYPGTGIGLANVKKAVTLLGGTIQVESVINSGSTFIISFTAT